MGSHGGQSIDEIYAGLALTERAIGESEDAWRISRPSKAFRGTDPPGSGPGDIM